MMGSTRKRYSVSHRGLWRSMVPFLLFTFLIFTVFPVCAVEEPEKTELGDEGYRLGVGEVISISTFDEPELAIKQARVSRTGVLSFPFIGKVNVLDRTVKDIEQEIEMRLQDGYLKKPKVIVKIDSYRDFFVNGAVNRPGAYAYSPGLTVRKAIAISGGLTDRASSKKIRLKKEFSEAEVVVSDVDEVMGPGDVLTIGESMF